MSSFASPIRLRRRVAALAATALVLGLLAVVQLSASPAASADTAPASGSGLPATMTADALPTMQVNGVVFAQATVGSTVYAGGAFSYARPAGQAPSATHAGETAVGDIAAYDITTGVQVSSFIHQLNGTVRTIVASPDGSRIYVGGDFTTVDGATHNHIVAFLTATGAVDKTFQASVGSTVWAIAATNSVVYVGGSFVTAGGVARTNLAAFNSLGAVISWAPVTNSGGYLQTMVLAPDDSRVIVGGHFTTLNGVANAGSGSLDAVTGATMPWALNQTLFDSGTQGAIDTLSTDGTLIYGGGYAFTVDGNDFEGRFAADPTTGAIVWANSCYGDTYDTLPIGKVLYSVSHDHDCEWVGSFPDSYPASEPWHRTMAETTYPNGGTNLPGNRPAPWTNVAGLPTAQVLDWFPLLAAAPSTAGASVPGTVAVSGASEAGWSLTTNAAGSYLAVGGEFPTANRIGQQGLVRYATHAIAPDKMGPVTVAGLATPTAVPGATAGSVNVSWLAGWDRDNQLLTYKLYRDGSTTPVYTTTAPSTFWQQPQLNYTDTGLAAGTHTYKLITADPDASAISASTTVTVTTGAPPTPPAASTDLALYRPTTQSSLWNPGYEASQAVDGVVGSGLTSAAVAGAALNSWWQVDLGSSKSLGTININGRTDCCTDQSSDYDVFVSNTPFDQRLTPAQQARQPGVYTYQQTGDPGPLLAITLPAGTTGRYVMIQHTSYDYLSLQEVTVLAAPVDLAQAKPATQSSTAAGGSAAQAVDGNTNGVFGAGSVSSTTVTFNPWWQVDLGASDPVGTVKVWARTDAAQSNLASYWVFVSNQPFDTTLTTAQQAQVAGVYAVHQTAAPNPSATVTLPSGSSGRYVMVQLDPPPVLKNLSSPLALQLAEVQVYS